VDPSITGRDIAAWSTQQLLNIIQTSTDPIKHKIVAIEHANEDIVKQTQHLHQELVVVLENHDKEHALHA